LAEAGAVVLALRVRLRLDPLALPGTADPHQLGERVEARRQVLRTHPLRAERGKHAHAASSLALVSRIRGRTVLTDSLASSLMRTPRWRSESAFADAQCLLIRSQARSSGRLERVLRLVKPDGGDGVDLARFPDDLAEPQQLLVEQQPD